MSDLVHEFSASASRSRIATTCARRYYLRIYEPWEGWGGKKPGKRYDNLTARLAYALSKSMGLAGVVGTVVHEASAALVRNANEGRADIPETEAIDRSIRLFDTIVSDAAEEKWKQDPKRYPPVVEAFYEDPSYVYKLNANRKKLLDCVRGLYTSEYFAKVRADLRAKALTLLAADDKRDELTIDVDGQAVKVFVVMDLALTATPADGQRWGVGELKSGRVSPADRKQVGLYGWALRERYGADLSRVKATTVYVRTGETVEAEATPETVEEGLEFIRAGVRAVRPYLVDGDVARNEALPVEEWPTNEGSECERCDQRGICSAWLARRKAA